MNNNLDKAKYLIKKAIDNYKDAYKKLDSNETEDIKKMKRKIEQEIDTLEKMIRKIERINSEKS